MKIKAITLWEPWATLVAIGAKQYETRGWTVGYRGPLAIHAARKWDEDNVPYCYREPFRSALKVAGFHSKADLSLGCVLAVVDWVDVHDTYRLAPSLSEQERAFGDYSPGRYAWEFENIRRLPEPLLVGGRQSLWEWDAPARLLPLLATGEAARPHLPRGYGKRIHCGAANDIEISFCEPGLWRLDFGRGDVVVGSEKKCRQAFRDRQIAVAHQPLWGTEQPDAAQPKLL